MNAHLLRIQNALEQSIRGISDQQMCRHPQGKWCMAEILEHLALTYGGTAKRMQSCLDSGAPTAGKPSLRDRFVTMVITKFAYIPQGRPAPMHVVPTGIPPAEARTLIFGNLSRMDEVMQKCEQRFGAKIKISNHPILGPLTLEEWRKFHLVHALHHVKQIQRLRSYVGEEIKAVAG